MISIFFRGIENTKKGEKLKDTEKALTHTTVRGQVLDLLLGVGLDFKKNWDSRACDEVVFFKSTVLEVTQSKEQLCS